MTDLELGLKPEPLTVNLDADSPFSAVLTYQDGATPWPDGTVIELRFAGDPTATPPVDPATWTAAIAGAEATWAIASDMVNLRVDRERAELRVNSFCWNRGRVIFRGR